MTMQERADELRRFLEADAAARFAEFEVSADLLRALFAGKVAVGDNEHSPEKLTELFYAVREQRNRLLWACDEFVKVNGQHGYEFDANEPETYRRMVEAIANARGQSHEGERGICGLKS